MQGKLIQSIYTNKIEITDNHKINDNYKKILVVILHLILLFSNWFDFIDAGFLIMSFWDFDVARQKNNWTEYLIFTNNLIIISNTNTNWFLYSNNKQISN